MQRFRPYLLILAGILAVVVLGAIHDNLNNYYEDILQRCGIAIAMAVSLNIVNGFTGQFSSSGTRVSWRLGHTPAPT